MATAFEALEKIGAAEANEPLPGAREVVHHFGFLLRRRHIERGLEIVGEAVAWQVQHGRCPRLCRNRAGRIGRPGPCRGFGR